jgi:hypothetical protein
MQFYAFDVLMMQAEDLRQLPLHLRKNNLARLLAANISLSACASQSRKLDNHIECPECGGWSIGDLGAVADHAGLLPHPAIDQPQ